MKKYAPIVIFAFNRADRLEALLDSLEANSLIEKMTGYVFVDIPDKKDKKNQNYNQEVIDFLEEYKQRTLFKKLTIIVAEKHKGLANSVISGVSQIINKHEKVIVLEDDLVVSNDFLDYMQRALVYYENDSRIWQISAYSPDLKILENYTYDTYLFPRGESWGWGTWKDRWNRTDWEVKSYKKFKYNYIEQFLFNIGGSDLSYMLKLQMKDSNYNSWAIRWCYQEFKERKYTVFPRENRILHCGNDSRSTHVKSFESQEELKDKYKRCKFTKQRINLKLVYYSKMYYKAPSKIRDWFMDIYNGNRII